MSSVAWSIEKNHFKALEKHPTWGFTYWAFDLHSTIIIPNYDDVNIPKEFYPFAKEVLQELSKRDDMIMIIYTCSHPHEIAQYVKLFEENGIHFKYVNNNPEVETREGKYGYYEDKFYFNVLFEDKASFNAETDWEDVYYLFKDLDSNINSRNEKLLIEFEEKHLIEGGKLPKETSLTNLVDDAIKRKDYKIYNGGGYDIDGGEIKKYDVVLWSNLSNDPYFMVVLDVGEGDQCDLYRCNDSGKIEKKVI